jgi:hypothetical protein
MADKNSLGFVGYIFGAITFAVTLIAVMVVRENVSGNLVADEPVTAQLMVPVSMR